ncbi:MAG TPA: hypothetical protein VMT46_08145 [Anaerolineaceae bacterium]|nr:hypothetical protein [Anaerolineaceae bacterium]
MPESKQTFEVEIPAAFPMRLKKSPGSPLPKRSSKPVLPARTEPDPAQSVDVVMRLIDRLKGL